MLVPTFSMANTSRRPRRYPLFVKPEICPDSPEIRNYPRHRPTNTDFRREVGWLNTCDSQPYHVLPRHCGKNKEICEVQAFPAVMHLHAWELAIGSPIEFSIVSARDCEA